MTTIPFAPSQTSAPPFSTQVVLDGNPYILTCAWNLYASTWYIALTDANGNVVVTQPLIGSPANANTYLAAGLFRSSTLLYRVATQSFEVSP